MSLSELEMEGQLEKKLENLNFKYVVVKSDVLTSKV